MSQQPHFQGVHLPPISLGTVIAERRILLCEQSGQAREGLVRLGLPIPVSGELGLPPTLHRCPAQILGLGIDDKIFAPPGQDPFDAIYNALDIIGQQVDHRASELNLRSSGSRFEPRTLNWIWKYLGT